MSRLRNLLRLPFYEKLKVLATIWHRTKTRVFYRRIFGSMGANCVLRNPLLLSNTRYIHLGSHVDIRDGVRMEVVLHNPARVPELRIGDHVNIEQNVHIICQSKILIGNDVSITGNCAIVDTTHPWASPESSQKTGDLILDEDSYVVIGDGTFLGFGCIVLPNVKIGKGAIIGANAVVSKDVPDYAVVAGIPAAVLRINSV
jgi:acetyltransferase-like isoleucine patch superfamily enzyme